VVVGNQVGGRLLGRVGIARTLAAGMAVGTGVAAGEQGAAAAIAPTAQQLGGSVGLAALVALLSERAVAPGGTGAGLAGQPAGVMTGALQWLIDMSTVGPEVIGSIAARLPSHVTLVDAPVRGSVPEATAGRLAIYVGATQAAFEHVQPLLAPLGTPHHVGGPGAGAATSTTRRWSPRSWTPPPARAAPTGGRRRREPRQPERPVTLAGAPTAASHTTFPQPRPTSGG
jgi:hypothetical protein